MKNSKAGLLLIVVVATALFSCGKAQNIPSTPYTPPIVYTPPTQYGTPYGNVPDTKDIVMYELNVRTFSPTTFKTVQARLDSIKALGVNVIWLMPTYTPGVLKSVGSPYAVKDYTGVNPNFGSLADLRDLVDRAHNLGMAVILDWVANHTAWDNAWITNKAWYQQDASGNIISPLNTTYSDVAALNFNNAEMRVAMTRAMKYWVYTANVDGFRCDYADKVPVDFWKQALDSLNTIKTHKLIYLTEGTSPANITAGFQMDYAFSYYATLKSLFAGTATPTALFSTNTTEYAALPATGTKLRYITNHDNAKEDGSTLKIYNNQQGALAAFVITTYMGGVPLIYDSQEIGWPNTIDFFTDSPVNYNSGPAVVAAYKPIIAFRKAHEAVKTGTLTPYTDANIVAFEKKSGTDNVFVMVNTKNSAQTFTIPAALQNTTWKNGLTNANITLSTQYTFKAYEYLVLTK